MGCAYLRTDSAAPLERSTPCDVCRLLVCRPFCAAALLAPPRRFGGTEPLADDVQVASRLDTQRLYGHQERNCIGFVHENKNVRRTHAHLNSRLAAWQGQEKQLKIRG